jgi:hypothetical protein
MRTPEDLVVDTGIGRVDALDLMQIHTEG